MTGRKTRHDQALPCLDQLMEELGRIAAERVDSGCSIGIAAGVVLADGRTDVTTDGDAGQESPVNEHTVFEIGSITKLFAAPCWPSWPTTAR